MHSCICAKCQKNIQLGDIIGVCLPSENKIPEGTIRAPGYPGFYIACENCITLHSYIGKLDKDNTVRDQSTIAIMDCESLFI